MKLQVNWDALGIATSLVCAIHCAVLPLLLTSLPLFGINIIHNNFFEAGMITLAFLIGSLALFQRKYFLLMRLLSWFRPFYSSWLRIFSTIASVAKPIIVILRIVIINAFKHVLLFF
jgi:MerC mercury resistance protein